MTYSHKIWGAILGPVIHWNRHLKSGLVLCLLLVAFMFLTPLAQADDATATDTATDTPSETTTATPPVDPTPEPSAPTPETPAPTVAPTSVPVVPPVAPVVPPAPAPTAAPVVPVESASPSEEAAVAEPTVEEATPEEAIVPVVTPSATPTATKSLAPKPTQTSQAVVAPLSIQAQKFTESVIATGSSPLVQGITIAILLAIGFWYFRVMRRGGKRSHISSLKNGK